MNIHTMSLNESAYFGAGARASLPAEIRRRGYQKALLVSDPELVRVHVTELVSKLLDEAGIPYALFAQVKPNPTIENVQAGVEAFSACGADFLIAVGGGSPIDTAKAIGIIVSNPEFADVRSLEGYGLTQRRSAPLIVLPTTAGTASEVTTTFVISDARATKKMICGDPNCLPVLAILDPELMLSMPRGLTAATGMDALTHAIEGYLTRGGWEMTDFLALRAIELIGRHLRAAVEQPANLEARSGMALGQYTAGMGFANAGLGIVHSMSHPLGAHYDTPHGVANALLLPYVMEFNAPACGEKYRQIALALGHPEAGGLPLDGAVRTAVEAVRELAGAIGIPQKLSKIGVQRQDLDMLSEEAFRDVCTFGNPRDVSVADLRQIYQQAFE